MPVRIEKSISLVHGGRPREQVGRVRLVRGRTTPAGIVSAADADTEHIDRRQQA